MDCVRAGDLGSGDDSRDLQVRIARRRRANAHVVIGEPNMQRLAIGVRVDGHGFDLELTTGADDAQRDLPAVRDQDFLEHAAGAGGEGKSAGAVSLTVNGRRRCEQARHAPRQSSRNLCGSTCEVTCSGQLTAPLPVGSRPSSCRSTPLHPVREARTRSDCWRRIAHSRTK